MSKLQETVDIYKKLKAEWSKRPCDLNKCGGYLSTLKVSFDLLQFMTLAREYLLISFFYLNYRRIRTIQGR